MVLTLAIPLRAVYGLEDFITMRHLENMAKVMLVTGLIVVYGYACEAFFGVVQRQTEYERFMMRNRIDRPVRAGLLGADPLQLPRAAAAVVRSACGPACRRSSSSRMFVNVGMWLERFVIIVTSLHRDFLPSSWGMYRPDDLGLRRRSSARSACSSR